MKYKIRILAALVLGLAACASLPAGSSAQQTPVTHHHYIVVDMGSLGGPGSIVYEQGTRSLNNVGTFNGCADTPNLDPEYDTGPIHRKRFCFRCHTNSCVSLAERSNAGFGHAGRPRQYCPGHQ